MNFKKNIHNTQIILLLLTLCQVLASNYRSHLSGKKELLSCNLPRSKWVNSPNKREYQFGQVEAQWQELIEQFRAEMEKDTDPASESVQVLARRSMELVGEFTGSDPGIEQSLKTMYQQVGPEVASRGACLCSSVQVHG